MRAHHGGGKCECSYRLWLLLITRLVIGVVMHVGLTWRRGFWWVQILIE